MIDQVHQIRGTPSHARLEVAYDWNAELTSKRGRPSCAPHLRIVDHQDPTSANQLRREMLGRWFDHVGVREEDSPLAGWPYDDDH
jgi:hypothetical protein